MLSYARIAAATAITLFSFLGSAPRNAREICTILPVSEPGRLDPYQDFIGLLTVAQID
jgi:hypothetical protein